MESRAFLRRIKVIFPVAGLLLVALVAVTIAMTTLGDTQADATNTPSASPAASPTIASAVRSATASPTASPVPTVSLPPTMPVIITVYKGDYDAVNRIWFVAWRYPQFRVGTTPLASVMNQDIVNEVTTRIQAFEEGPAAVRQLPGKTNNLTGTFTVNMLAPDLASLTLKWVDDTSPAHPSTTIETLNYALNSGQRLDFDQIFEDTEAAGAIISQQSMAQLRKTLGKDYDPSIVDDGAAAVPENFDNWALTPAGFKVTFAEFQVGTYADGMPSVLIPWSILKSVMLPNGPAARLAGYPTPS